MATTNTIRCKIDNELARRVGKWFTVRQIQDKLRINPSTLKPLIMKYARENVLRRRHVKGTARSVEFSPAANTINAFKDLLNRNMPYRNLGSARTTRSTTRHGGRTTSRVSRTSRWHRKH
jgi:hypothetical protein